MGATGLVHQIALAGCAETGRPRYFGIAWCCFGDSIALIALGAPFGNIQHKGTLCALGN